MSLAIEGVLLKRQACSRDLLASVVAEYEAQAPQQIPPPKHEPIVVYWKHVAGERKRIVRMAQMPVMEHFVHACAELARPHATGELRLLETIIFNKPPRDGARLNWHQDVSYFPFEPNNQIALWIPFERVTRESGAMVYAIGSHLRGLRASTDLHTGDVFRNEARPPIPDDPTAEGLEVRCMEMEPGDVLLHDGRTWHTSGPNLTDGPRRGLSVRFLVGDTFYKPVAGSAAAFMQQIDAVEGDKIDDPAFPVL